MMFENSFAFLSWPDCIMLAKQFSALAVAFSMCNRDRPHQLGAAVWPPVTILKPLCGHEPGLFESLESFCKLDYPKAQIVFGVHKADDPSLQVVRKLVAAYPANDISIVVNSSLPCRNRKVANLINMMPTARHDVVVVSDSDMLVGQAYLKSVISELMVPGVGLVTTLYTGRTARRSFAADLGLAYINWYFVPGVLLGAALGRQDCFGATMAIRRNTLQEIGNFEVIGSQLADDAELGRLVRASGLKVTLAPVIPETTVVETSILSLLQHELRWAVTMRSVAPISFGLSLVQYPTVWASVSLFMSPRDLLLVGNLILICVAQWAFATCIDRCFGINTKVNPILIPIREFLSVAVTIWSFFCPNVTWRGEGFRVGYPWGWLVSVPLQSWTRVFTPRKPANPAAVEFPG